MGRRDGLARSVQADEVAETVVSFDQVEATVAVTARTIGQGPGPMLKDLLVEHRR